MPRDSFGPTKDANSCMISTSSSSKCSGWPSYETYRAGLTVKFLEMARPCHFYEQTSSIWTSLSVKTSSSTSVWIKGLHVSKVDASDAVMLVESCKISPSISLLVVKLGFLLICCFFNHGFTSGGLKLSQECGYDQISLLRSIAKGKINMWLSNIPPQYPQCLFTEY